MSDEEDYLFKDVVYKPCKLCGSISYDQADGDVIESEEGEPVYEPRTCDQCNFGDIKHSNTQIH